MKSTNRILALILSFFTFVLSAQAVSVSDEESFEMLSDKLHKAMEVRNFHVARETIEELMPLMKQQLKEDKKTLSVLKKADEPEIDPKTFEKNYKRKTELYESLKKLVNVSPAALRVKSDLIKKEVKEFIDLS